MSTEEPLLSADETIAREMNELSEAMAAEEPGSAAKAEMQKRWLEWDARRMEHEESRAKSKRASHVKPDTWVSAATTLLLCAATLAFESRDIITSSAKRFWQQRFKADRED